MMRRPLTLTVCAALAVAATAFTLGGCGSSGGTDGGASASGTAAGDDTLQLVTDGTLTVCTSASYKPFEFRDGNDIVGFDIDIVHEVAKDLDATAEFIDVPFEGLKSGAALNSGKCDVAAAAMTINAEREEVMGFSDPYYTASQALLVKADSGIAGLAGLGGKRVGAQAGTTGLTYAEENLPDAEIVEFEALPQLAAAVKTGQVDAGINDNGVLRNYATENDDVTVVEEFGTDEEYGFATAKENTAMVTALNDTLARLESDGTYDTIEKKWFGEG